MKVEEYFFRYAFPCIPLKLKSKEISKKEYDKLEKKFLDDKAPTRDELEKIFQNAFFWIKKLAEKRGKDYWSYEVIREYWERDHNKRIMSFEHLSEKTKDLCRVIRARVIEKYSDRLVVGYKGRTREVFNKADANEGDYVLVHYNYAVEKI